MRNPRGIDRELRDAERDAQLTGDWSRYDRLAAKAGLQRRDEALEADVADDVTAVLEATNRNPSPADLARLARRMAELVLVAQEVDRALHPLGDHGVPYYMDAVHVEESPYYEALTDVLMAQWFEQHPGATPDMFWEAYDHPDNPYARFRAALHAELARLIVSRHPGPLSEDAADYLSGTGWAGQRRALRRRRRRRLRNRQNPDERMRRLARAARLGDPDAARSLEALSARTPQRVPGPITLGGLIGRALQLGAPPNVIEDAIHEAWEFPFVPGDPEAWVREDGTASVLSRWSSPDTDLFVRESGLEGHWVRPGPEDAHRTSFYHLDPGQKVPRREAATFMATLRSFGYGGRERRGNPSPDERLRRLHREAAARVPGAPERLERELWRRGKGHRGPRSRHVDPTTLPELIHSYRELDRVLREGFRRGGEAVRFSRWYTMSSGDFAKVLRRCLRALGIRVDVKAERVDVPLQRWGNYQILVTIAWSKDQAWLGGLLFPRRHTDGELVGPGRRRQLIEARDWTMSHYGEPPSEYTQLVAEPVATWIEDAVAAHAEGVPYPRIPRWP